METRNSQMLPAEDGDEFCLPSSLQSKPDSIAHENVCFALNVMVKNLSVV